jgi:hypothetical protein
VFKPPVGTLKDHEPTYLIPRTAHGARSAISCEV